ncbi:GDSL-type esterase/lipase family protein [Evansella tamaricis]|uniref:SGNH hydrolase-type esterase domain-containing protein n=1 Tax=Evansella tamaricis TaxID=2069301 RepID=A0ABS6JJ55_9BACI|nr:GDSL-type esterase/lipase family protein [Evansella tamaricis]MBU9713568.1 hypothetical protein [Evansella tamaricis]
MNKNRISIILALLIFIVHLSASEKEVIAEEQNRKKLVSLGDSITAGYNLDNSEKQAFPFLIDEERFEVENLGVPGWTSSDLLYVLENDETFWSPIQHANMVTINIGNNDLLYAIQFYDLIETEDLNSIDPFQIEADVQKAQQDLAENLTHIINTIRERTEAPIILYNLYNPVITDGTFFWNLVYNIIDDMVEDLNDHIFSNYHSQLDQVAVVDVHTAFSGKQDEYIFEGDIHPNEFGQKKLAKLAREAIKRDIDGRLVLQEKIFSEVREPAIPATAQPEMERITATETEIVKERQIEEQKSQDSPSMLSGIDTTVELDLSKVLPTFTFTPNPFYILGGSFVGLIILVLLLLLRRKMRRRRHIYF